MLEQHQEDDVMVSVRANTPRCCSFPMLRVYNHPKCLRLILTRSTPSEAQVLASQRSLLPYKPTARVRRPSTYKQHHTIRTK